jgi:endonuclease/exonuclease/phosphatase family metal-dependent hydrolase
MPAFNVLTLNAHMGFNLLNRRFVLPELREAIRSVSADVVFLQEVLGEHARHAQKHLNWPDGPQYEFLADTLWPQFRLWPQRGVSARPPRQRAAVEIPDRAPREPRHLHPWQRGARPAALRARAARHGGKYTRSACTWACSNRIAGNSCPCSATSSRPKCPTTRPGRRRRLQRLAPARASAPGALRLQEVFMQHRGALARTFPARWPLLPVDRIYARNVRGIEPRVLSARPWSHLSDHAPLLARIEW